MRLYLAPGFHGTGELFGPLVSALDGNVSPQLISYPENLGPSLDAYVDFLAGQIDHEKPYLLLGESFSGPVALSLLARGAESCKGLLLIATFISNPAPFPTLLATTLLSPFLGIRPPRWAICRYLVGRNGPSDLVDCLCKIASTLKRRIVLERFQILRQLRLRDYDPWCPCHYMRAEGDELVSSAKSDELVAHVAGCTVSSVPGAHLIAQHSPEVVAAQIAIMAVNA